MSAPGSFTEGFDLIQVLLSAFFAFFALLVLYLRREDKREGYPLEPTTAGRTYPVLGWPAPPPPKTYRLMDGSSVTLPHRVPQAPMDSGRPPAMGQPLPVGGPWLTSGLGAGAYVLRADAPMRTASGDPVLQPLRDVPDWRIGRGETDLRGSRIAGRDLRPVGTVTDLWIDRIGLGLRYLEVELDGDPDPVLVPIFHADIGRRGQTVVVWALRGEQFRLVPRPGAAGTLTAREEDRLNAFYAGAEIYGDARVGA